MVTNFTSIGTNGFLDNLKDSGSKGFEGIEVNRSLAKLNRVYLENKFNGVLYHTATDLIKNEQLIVSKVNYQNEVVTVTLNNKNEIKIKL